MLNTETLVRHCLVGAHAAGCAQAEPQTATDIPYFDHFDVPVARNLNLLKDVGVSQGTP